MWTALREIRRPSVRGLLLVEAGVMAVLLCVLILWGLLAALGDERGAAAAHLVAVAGGIGLGLLQILLVHLLALGAVAVKMDSESRV